MECLSICIYSRCIRSFEVKLRPISPPLLNNYLHIHTQGSRSVAIKDFLPGNSTIPPSPQAGCLLALLGIYKTTAKTPADLALEISGYRVPQCVCVCLRRGGRMGVVLVYVGGGQRWEPVRGSPWGSGGPRQQQLPSFCQGQKGLPCTPASGPPSQRDREGVSPPYLSLPPSPPVLFVQPGGITQSRGQIQGPNRPGLIPFTCDPHFHNKMMLWEKEGW